MGHPISASLDAVYHVKDVMIEIARTKVMSNIDLLTYAVQEGGQFVVHIMVSSTSIVQDSFGRVLFYSGTYDNELIAWAMAIHMRVMRHIRKKYRKNQVKSKYYRHLYEKQNGRCYLCGNEMRVVEATRDHVMPVSRGGPKGRDNILLTHGSCNLEKDNRLPTSEELAYLAKITEQMEKDFGTFEDNLAVA